MAIDHILLQKVKTNLRISHDVLDEDLSDTIAACLADLTICGVHAPVTEASEEFDPILLNAVKLYCRKEYTDDTAKAAAYQERYDALKSCLMMASEYSGEAAADE